MTFSYYDSSTGKKLITTNLKSLSEFSGIPYHKVYNWFRNGTDVHIQDSIVCFRDNLSRGKQRIPKKQKKKEEKFDDFFKTAV